MDRKEPGDVLRGAACALLRHRLSLEQEQAAAETLAAMGVSDPRGADGLLLGQYLKALGGDTAAAKFVRDAASAAAAETEPAAPEDLKALSDAALYALAAEAPP